MVVLKHNSIKTAAALVKNGGLIVYPTDTIWGLGCDGLNADAVAKLRAIKQKPTDQPLIWLLPSLTAVKKYFPDVTPFALKLLRQKKTTVVMPNGQSVRLITHGWLNHLLKQCAVPLVATSANLHSQPVVTSWRQATAVFANTDVTILRGRKIAKNKPSTVVAIQGTQIKILRQGGGILIK